MGASATAQKSQGLLSPNPAGPHRFFRRLDSNGGVDDLVQALSQRLEAAVPGLQGRPRDTTLGRVCSYIEPGGSFTNIWTDTAKLQASMDSAIFVQTSWF